MTAQATPQTAETLNTLRLPELWALFAERTGESSRCPNRAFLIRRILSAQAAVADALPVSAEADAGAVIHVPDEKVTPLALSEALDTADPCDEEAQAVNDSKVIAPLTELALESLLLEDAPQQVDAPRRRRVAAQGKHQVLPVRFPVEAVEQLDAARERLGLPSRMALFRRALRSFLFANGEASVARLLERM